MKQHDPLREAFLQEEDSTSREMIYQVAEVAEEDIPEHDELSFNYSLLDLETRQLVEQKTLETHGLLKRTAEHILTIGKNLAEVKAALGHGHFLSWIQLEFGMSRHTAQHFMRVASRFEGKWRNFHHLPVSVLYELAAPSTPDGIIEQVMSGDLDASLPAIREAKAAKKQAQEAEQAARRQAQEAAIQLETMHQEAKRQEQRIEQLTRQMYELHQQIELTGQQALSPSIIEKVVEKAVVPPEMQAHLERLQQQVKAFSLEREGLLKHIERLSAQTRSEFFEQNTHVERGQQVRQQWKATLSNWQKSTNELSALWPTLLDTESFGQEEWVLLDRLKEAAQGVVQRCEKLVQARDMIVEANQR